MKRTSRCWTAPLAGMVALGLLAVPPAMAQQAGGEDARLNELQRQINEQTSKLAQMRQSLQQQEAGLAQLQQSLNEEILASARARGAPAPVLLPSLSQGVGYAPSTTVGAATPAPAAVAQQQAPEPNAEVPRQRVGQAPESDSRPPEVAQIFDQPGVLTPPGKFVLEPSLQYGYYANDRVALVGYTVIPAILIGLIDVRQVKTTTGVSTLTTRYGVGKRFELELKLPYVYVNTDTISREVFTGSAQDRVFNVNGSGVGDVEMTARYQINQGGPDKPFYIGWLRYKSRSGRDPFEVVTDCVTRCVANTTGTGLPLESPTGSGFEAIQPGVTWLFPSDPVVFFGSLSYLHNFKRSNVTRTLLLGAEENIGDIEAGDIIGFNLGLGLALNEKASISMGYDQSIIDRTKQNGKDIPGSARITQGTLLLGGTYRFNDNVSFNMALGAGLTRDTPDLTVTARVPITF